MWNVDFTGTAGVARPAGYRTAEGDEVLGQGFSAVAVPADFGGQSYQPLEVSDRQLRARLLVDKATVSRTQEKVGTNGTGKLIRSICTF